MHILVYNLVQALVCLYALARGGSPERLVAIMFLVAAGATYLVPFVPNHSWHSVRVPILLIDLALLAGLVGIAVRANRFWPIWIGALHLLTVAVHGIRAIDPAFVSWMYGAAIGKIAYPMLLLLLIATARHRRRLLDRGRDPDWSPAARA